MGFFNHAVQVFETCGGWLVCHGFKFTSLVKLNLLRWNSRFTKVMDTLEEAIVLDKSLCTVCEFRKYMLMQMLAFTSPKWAFCFEKTREVWRERGGGHTELGNTTR